MEKLPGAVVDRGRQALHEWSWAERRTLFLLIPTETKPNGPILSMAMLCNIDVAFLYDIDKVGIAVCLGDDPGRFLMVKIIIGPSLLGHAGEGCGSATCNFMDHGARAG